jgi:lipoprotein-anchoring transpeptidase ErfK/SrfK
MSPNPCGPAVFPFRSGVAQALGWGLRITGPTAAALALGALPGLAVEPPPPLPAMPVASPAVSRPQKATGAAPTGAVPTRASRASGAAVPSVPAATAATYTNTREIRLELRKRTISLVDSGRVLGSWPVAIGDPATPTPTGRFAVRNKVVNPQYQSTTSGKNNPTIGPLGPLGDRWLGFHTTAKDQFGIHGTPPAWEQWVKTRSAVSHGCVRMLGPHVRQLFDQVEVGTPVIVTP